MMCAISIKQKNPNLTVAIIDKQSQVGTKLRLTGGGRCNVTVMISPDQFIQNMPQNGKFLYPALAKFGPQSIYDYFNSIIPLKVEKHDRVFPTTNKSISIIETLLDQLQLLDVDIHLNEHVRFINTENKSITTHLDTYRYQQLVVATGGFTMPRTGSSGDGYDFAKSFGHTITPLFPVEVPINTVEDTTYLQGISLYDHVLSVVVKGKVKRTLTYDLIFTHYGLSGPGILRLSTDIQLALTRSQVPQIVITLMDAQTLEACKQNLRLHKAEHPKQTLYNALYKHLPLPKKIIDYLLARQKIDSMPLLNQFTDSRLNEMIDSFRTLTFTVDSTFGFEQAFVTMGGVSLKEVNPSTYESKIDNTISFVGEVLDLNGWTGGYNLTIAFSSGHLAGSHIATKLKSSN